MLFVAAASRGAIGFAMKGPANNESLPGPDTLRYMPQTGYAALGAGGLLAAAVAMATMSWLIVRTAVAASRLLRRRRSNASAISTEACSCACSAFI